MSKRYFPRSRNCPHSRSSPQSRNFPRSRNLPASVTKFSSFEKISSFEKLSSDEKFPHSRNFHQSTNFDQSRIFHQSKNFHQKMKIDEMKLSFGKNVSEVLVMPTQLQLLASIVRRVFDSDMLTFRNSNINKFKINTKGNHIPLKQLTSDLDFKTKSFIRLFCHSR